MRVAVAVSGGVDSLCALLLLRRAGHDIIALHGHFLERHSLDDASRERLESACRALGVDLFIADLAKQFTASVIEPFLAAHAAGRTPNPCALCNRSIKFGSLLGHALSLGADALATGHYASLVPNPYNDAPKRIIAPGADARKDQSYFLAMVPAQALSRMLLPLANLAKTECRKMIAQGGLEIPVAAESHDICFMDSSVGAFLKKSAPDVFRPNPGAIYLLEPGASPGQPQRLGRHYGLWNYTEGQRRGLNLPHREPLYVLRKDHESNSLFVGPRSSLGMIGCMAENLNFHVDPAHWPERIQVKLRFSHKPLSAAIEFKDRKAIIHLADVAFPTAPGQIASFHDEAGRLLGGAIVEKISTI